MGIPVFSVNVVSVQIFFYDINILYIYIGVELESVVERWSPREGC